MPEEDPNKWNQPLTGPMKETNVCIYIYTHGIYDIGFIGLHEHAQ